MTQQCTATAKSTGEQCQNDAIKGGNVCWQHGGAASQVQAKAQERLDRMADDVTADMQDILDDLTTLYDNADPEEKVEIAREIRQNWVKILDRTGHGPTDKREVEHSGNAGIVIHTEADDGDD
jgi:Skp family chaperone for outer membrane proteins